MERKLEEDGRERSESVASSEQQGMAWELERQATDAYILQAERAVAALAAAVLGAGSVAAPLNRWALPDVLAPFCPSPFAWYKA